MDGNLAEVSQRLNRQKPKIGASQPSSNGARHADMVAGLTIVLREYLLPATARITSLSTQHGRIEASPLVWLDYCHAVIDRALSQLDAKGLAAGMAEFASAMLWFKSSQNTLAIAPIPPATGDAMLHPGVEAALLDYSLAFLTISIGQGRAVNEEAQHLFDCLNEVLPAVPRSLRAALCFDAETSRPHMEPLIYEWCRCLQQSAEQLRTAAGLSYFLVRAVNYLVPSSQRYIAGAVVAKIAVERWSDILENQRFSLSFPNLHEDSIRNALGSKESDPLKMVANIVLALSLIHI